MPGDDPHLADRSARAALIIANPRRYKVCAGCDSIIARRADLCPHCNSYRFDRNDAAVTEQARLLASREQTSVTLEDLF